MFTTIPRTSLFMLILLLLDLSAVSADSAFAEDAAVVKKPDDKKDCLAVELVPDLESSVHFCGEPARAKLDPGSAVITIKGRSNLTVICDEGFVVTGNESLGTNELPTAGILIENSDKITIKGCAFSSFRYGIIAKNSSNITLEKSDLSGNFNDPTLGLSLNSVKGGGVLFENIAGGKIVESKLSRNWNAIQLRNSKKITVIGNTASHNGNAGMILVDSHDNNIENNDFSWSIRGINMDQFSGVKDVEKYLAQDAQKLPAEQTWYGVDSKGSAGMILDAGSTKNMVRGNNLEYSGTGIFVGSVIGNCAINNYLISNKASFSPNNGIESWCDGNEFHGNIASNNNFGFWLRGNNRAKVIANVVANNNFDGISIQIGASRHTIIDRNYIGGNGRVGLLLSGKEYQAGQPLTQEAPFLANSSHILVQTNNFKLNKEADIFTSATRGLFVTNNSATDDKGKDIPLNFKKGPMSEQIVEVKSTGKADLFHYSEARLFTSAKVVFVGEQVEIQAATSAPGNLSYTWLVQPAAQRFAVPQWPKVVFQSERSADSRTSIVFDTPGVYDVNLIVDNGDLAALAFDQVIVLQEQSAVMDASRWSYECVDAAADCRTLMSFVNNAFAIAGNLSNGVNNNSSIAAPGILFEGDARFTVRLDYKLDDQEKLSMTAKTKFGFFIRANNPNASGWQSTLPVVEVVGVDGSVARYSPIEALLPSRAEEWNFIEVPLQGGEGWVLDNPLKSDPASVRVVTATNGHLPYRIWIAGFAAF